MYLLVLNGVQMLKKQLYTIGKRNYFRIRSGASLRKKLMMEEMKTTASKIIINRFRKQFAGKALKEAGGSSSSHQSSDSLRTEKMALLCSNLREAFVYESKCFLRIVERGVKFDSRNHSKWV